MHVITLSVFLAAVVVCQCSTLASTRNSLIVGNVGRDDRLLSRSYVYRRPVGNTVQSESVFWGESGALITCVQALEVAAPQQALVRVSAGGPGSPNVTVRFQSRRGLGYHYLLDIWGR